MKLQERLIGAQIIKTTRDSFTVKMPNGDTRTFVVVEDEGDCCGYNDWELKIFKDNIERNPVITKVEWEEQELGGSDTAKITLFGEYEPLVNLDSESSSGSGW